MSELPQTTPQSTIDFIPVLNHVLLRMDYTLAFVAFGQEKASPVNPILTVAGYGEQTTNLHLGDIVIMTSDYRAITSFLIEIPSNKKSWSHYTKAHKLLSKEDAVLAMKRNIQYPVVDYLVVPEYAIFGRIPKGTESYNIAIADPKLTKKEVYNLFSTPNE